MPKIQLINHTTWDSEPIRKMLGYLAADLPLNQPFEFLLQHVWTELDSKTGQIEPGTEQPDVEYDGTAWDRPNSRFIRVCVSLNIEYPVDWDIDPELPGKYLRFVASFQDCGELLLYLAAHECRHLWQYEHPVEAESICKQLKVDYEADADFYALRKLSQYRHDPASVDLSF